MYMVACLLRHWAQQHGPIKEGFAETGGFGQLIIKYLNPLVIFDSIFETMTFVWVAAFYYTLYDL